MASEEKSFTVTRTPRLILEDLAAIVTVRPGATKKISVTLRGTKEALEDITVRQEGDEAVAVRGTKQAGSVSVSGISICSGGSVCISGVSGMVVVNGKVVVGGSAGDSAGQEKTYVEIQVPEGTSIDLSDVKETVIDGIKGSLDARVSGQGNLKACEVNGARIKCSGQSGCDIDKASGRMRLSTSGQSHIEVAGTFGDIEAEASGQSGISAYGDCNDFEAETSGQSKITLRGQAKGRVSRHSSGQSNINIR